MGLISYQKRDFNKAYKEFSETIEMKSDYALAYYNRALSLIKLDKNDDACVDFRKAKSLGHKTVQSQIDNYCAE